MSVGKSFVRRFPDSNKSKTIIKILFVCQNVWSRADPPGKEQIIFLEKSNIGNLSSPVGI